MPAAAPPSAPPNARCRCCAPGKSLRFVALPAGEDPDSLIRGRGAEAIRRVLELARPLADVIWDLETEGKPADTPERRASIRRAV